MAAVQATTAKPAGGSRPAWMAGLLAAAVGIAIVSVVIATAPRAAQQPANQGTTAGAGGAQDATAYVAYRQSVAGLTAALNRHDWTSVARFRAQLDDSLTPAAIQAIYAARQQLQANLSAAEARHDARMVAVIKQELGSLCPPVTTPSALSFCN